MKAIVLAMLLLATPAFAQDERLDKRVGTLETQMRAVQRKVFPGGDPRFFTPEIAPATSAPAEPIGTPASSALADLTARVDALERQQRTLTGQVEEAQFKLRQLDETLTKFRGDTESRLTAIEGPKTTAPAADAAPVAAPDAAVAPPIRTPAKPPAKPEVAATPASIEDTWRAAYALYVAKDYSRAETAMQDFLTNNPKSARASNAQYWLGRSYMAQDSFAQAAKAFLDGYQKYPKGDRAPDSLLWLGNALAALKKPDQACRSLNELESVYGETLTPALKSAAAKSRKDAKCDA
ncbi:tol-pal system protein YbgF [Polymorphobacter sp. PAMC 29334]|uniref:tol-pal system protein YbgF n=1 Tax=Polymorphobacter sp. PAMC 29334 TaxID=2862331 RepID=UPI001C789AC5|nr:tol-pal system protein YbgF [Polymorphobacter sp. PAMC 29334]QYE36062.1 tol-pal system protein YbgF [Polymorphobacter sp. PAMC 29334]